MNLLMDYYYLLNFLIILLLILFFITKLINLLGQSPFHAKISFSGKSISGKSYFRIYGFCSKTLTNSCRKLLPKGMIPL